MYLHRSLGGQPQLFDEPGVQLSHEDGQPLTVGARDSAAEDFDWLQGARTTIAAADFDGDRRVDLVVGDTFGKVRVYRNLGTPQMHFAEPTQVGSMTTRMVPYAADWDSDGAADVVGSSAAGEVVWYRNTGTGSFEPAQHLNVPPVPYGPSAAIVDWNGDGDLDLLVGTDYGYCCWFERSFLQRGYAVATLVDD